MKINSAAGGSFECCDDNTLAEMARRGDKDALNELLLRYIPLIRKKASTVKLSSMDADDIAQEGFIGMLDAVRGFKPEFHKKFSAFANVCVDNRIKKAISKATTKKNAVLNNSVNIDDIKTDIACEDDDPQNIYIQKEAYFNLKKQIDALLSSFEQEVFSLYLAGQSYEQIARSLDSTSKSVDNALQRIRRKLKITSM